MVVLNRIYTRTGDDGTTALGSGERISKTSLRVETYGTVDETNAAIGLAAALLVSATTSSPSAGSSPAASPVAGDPAASMAARLARIQNDLFDLGADLCVPQSQNETPNEREGDIDGEGGVKRGRQPSQASSALRVTPSQVVRLEAEIDDLNADLSPLRSFVLPGGSPAAAQLHVARTVCRRAERLMVALATQPGETVNAAALQYINRLSDFLFVASRHVNDHGRNDVLWVPGGNR